MYKLKVEEVEKTDGVNFELPELPFVIYLINTETNYLISKNHRDVDNYIGVNLETGNAYANYREQEIRNFLTNDSWKLVKSTLTIEK